MLDPLLRYAMAAAIAATAGGWRALAGWAHGCRHTRVVFSMDAFFFFLHNNGGDSWAKIEERL